jgi:hypothetical protein
VHLLPVKLTPDGVELHRLLNAYLVRLWALAREPGKRDLHLVAMVLGKRAFSSARSLASSIERRMAGLIVRHASGQAGDIDAPAQTPLPLGFDDDPSDEASLPSVPAFEIADDEQVVLQRLLEAAWRVQRSDRKMHVLQRIVRRVREPLIIFTEYRDTLHAIRDEIGDLRRITSIHGGQTTHERRESVRAFTTGSADVLIATDAGSEGLNLHGTCRLVVNLELPWNPIRLEQRIGRVDRIGQTRTVHAINLFADGTAERTVLANLIRRLDRIRMSEIDIAACVIGHAEPAPRSATVEMCTRTTDLRTEASAETKRLRHTRCISAARSTLPDWVVPVTSMPARDASIVCFFRIRLLSGAGRLLEDGLVPVRLRIDPPRHRLDRKAARALAESLIDHFGPELLRHARAYGDERAHSIATEAARPSAAAAARERQIANAMTARKSPLVQAGLFDSRALREKSARDECHRILRQDSVMRANLFEADASVHLAGDPELVMVLIQCSQG